MSVLSAGRCLTLTAALAVALSASACARTSPAEQEGRSSTSEATETGRTINGHTYTNTPVDVKLGPNTFRIPANYFDSQIGPFDEGMDLKLEWPGMTPTAPGARAAPRSNDFFREIAISVDYIDRLPIEGAMARRVTNDGHTTEGSLERQDPSARLDLRVAQPERMGLTPYAINEELRVAYAHAQEAKTGRPFPRNLSFEPDWYIARSENSDIATFIRCDNATYREDGVVLEGEQVTPVEGAVSALCTHYFVDVDNSLSITLSYKRAFLKNWKAMELAILDVLNRTKVQ
ncbi:MAG: hypothetical protein ACREPC_01730 [Stenotrophomonas sp.]|uniref:hypothetical protein n=1 Tax=Gammaproteobacteria TaxID=1236 RepID=UPI003D6DA088